MKGEDVDLSFACAGQDGSCPVQRHCIEVFCVYLAGFGTDRISASRSTLASLLDVLQAQDLYSVLSDNNGMFTTLETRREAAGEGPIQTLAVKIPFAAHLNGAFYLRCCPATGRTTIVSFMDVKSVPKLILVLQRMSEMEDARIDPFEVLAVLALEGANTLESARKDLDKEICKAEFSTGASLLANPFPLRADINAYPPIFDRLHKVQLELVIIEREIQFQNRLLAFLEQQREISLKLQQQAKTADPLKSDLVDRSSHDVTNALRITSSKLENMIEQVGMLNKRVSIQLHIVSELLPFSIDLTAYSASL